MPLSHYPAKLFASLLLAAALDARAICRSPRALLRPADSPCLPVDRCSQYALLLTLLLLMLLPLLLLLHLDLVDNMRRNDCHYPPVFGHRSMCALMLLVLLLPLLLLLHLVFVNSMCRKSGIVCERDMSRECEE